MAISEQEIQIVINNIFTSCQECPRAEGWHC